MAVTQSASRDASSEKLPGMSNALKFMPLNGRFMELMNRPGGATQADMHEALKAVTATANAIPLRSRTKGQSGALTFLH